MVHARELEDINEFICPVCGAPLSFLRRLHLETEELAILVTCEFCDEYHGFVILTGLQREDLRKFKKYRRKPMKALITGYEWG